MGTTQYIAFLRAINVGGRVVKMTELIKIFERLRLGDVSTFIASGNVIFTSPLAAAVVAGQIEDGLRRALGYPVATMVRSTREVATVAAYEAFPPAEAAGVSLHVGFMREKAPAAAVRKALALQTAIDGLHVNGREVYWLARKNFADATISGALVEKALQTPVTFRNINTVRRLAAKYPSSASGRRDG
jgi:uncharacterized protein (DUF1697 family)